MFKTTEFSRTARMMLGLFGLCVLALVLAISLACSMNPKDRANPLDPLNPETGYDPFRLELAFVEVTTESDTATKIKLDWLDIEHSALDEYHIYRRVANDFDDWLTVIAVTSPGESYYVDLESDPTERYYYQVTATFHEGTDSLSSESVVNNRLAY